MDEIKRKEVKLSEEFHNSLLNVYIYGEETFGKMAAKNFIANIYSRVWCLDEQYLMHPECRFLTTKGKKYRNIIIGPYLIIYRITQQVEVLVLIRSSMSIAKKRKSRRIKI